MQFSDFYLIRLASNLEAKLLNKVPFKVSESKNITDNFVSMMNIRNKRQFNLEFSPVNALERENNHIQ